jgi:site-specific recombinase
MDGLVVPLLLVIGAVAFTFGFFIGTQVFTAVLRRREQALARERRVLNAVWRRLHRRFGIEKASWMAGITDQPRSMNDCDVRR